jgi:hypothetical protein
MLAACGVRTSDDAVTAGSAVSEQDWAALRGRLQGKLFVPGDGGYDAARTVYNPLFDDRRPGGVASCERPEDVQACVGFARDAGVRVAARSGGHSYAGYSTPDEALVVDVGAMKNITVNPDGTAVVGAGARLFDVYSALAAAGRCLPAGSCPSVGVSGLTLGGGIGVLARKYGLTCDRLRAADEVLADGMLKTVNADNDADLFWALRGGGGGNFGIVTSFTFDAPPAPDTVTVFKLAFPGASVPAVLLAWQDWLTNPGPPNELWSNVILSGGSTPSCSVGGSFLGSKAALQGLLDDLVFRVKQTGGQGPIAASSYSVEKSYIDAMRYFGGCSNLSPAQCHLTAQGGTLQREAFVASSCMLNASMSGDDATAIADLLTSYHGVALLFDSLGGAVGALDGSATAFAHRSAIASVQVYSGVRAGDAHDKEHSTYVVNFVRSALAQRFGAGAYINYIDPNIADWAGESYGQNQTRLRQVAQTYDPNAFFRFAQGLAQQA